MNEYNNKYIVIVVEYCCSCCCTKKSLINFDFVLCCGGIYSLNEYNTIETQRNTPLHQLNTYEMRESFVVNKKRVNK